MTPILAPNPNPYHSPALSPSPKGVFLSSLADHNEFGAVFKDLESLPWVYTALQDMQAFVDLGMGGVEQAFKASVERMGHGTFAQSIPFWVAMHAYHQRLVAYDPSQSDLFAFVEDQLAAAHPYALGEGTRDMRLQAANGGGSKYVLYGDRGYHAYVLYRAHQRPNAPPQVEIALRSSSLLPDRRWHADHVGIRLL
jgi:hypothetical protein